MKTLLFAAAAFFSFALRGLGHGIWPVLARGCMCDDFSATDADSNKEARKSEQLVKTLRGSASEIVVKAS